LALVPVPQGTGPGPSEAHQRQEAVLPLHRVYLLCDGPAANNAYSWMLPEDFEHLSSPGGHKILERWVAALDLRAHAVHVPPNKEEDENGEGWGDRADLAQGMGRGHSYSMQQALDGVPVLPVLTMNHPHAKHFRSMRLDSQARQAFVRKEINRTMRYQCQVCAVTHEFRFAESAGSSAEHQH